MELITNNNAEKIKYIILNSYFENKSINLEYKNIKTIVKIDGITETEKSQMFSDMDMFWFLNSTDEDNEFSCININGKKEILYMNMGQWGSYKYDIQNMHLVLGTTTSKFGGSKEYFSQIEISQSIEDDKYIYIIKNITDLAGRGAISRVNSGLKDDKDKKHARRTRLVNKLNSKVISHDNKDWMVINQINKSDLDVNDKHNDIFYELIKDIINYSLTIEDIIAEDNQIAK